MPEALNSLAEVLLVSMAKDITFLSTDWLWWSLAIPGVVVSAVLLIKWFMITVILTAPLWVPIAMIVAWRRS